MSAGELKRTPFYDFHVKAGAKMVSFAGFEMPVQYQGGITAEHQCVRAAAGVFDVSHMGEFEVSGKDALALVSYVTSNDPSALEVGQVQYSALLHPSGGIVDDCLVYRFADRLMLVVNAANIAKDWAHISSHLGGFDLKLSDVSDATALLALQGPQAQRVLAPLCPDVDLESLGYYRFTTGHVAGAPCVVSRTGYTGEDGFELYHAPLDAAKLWEALVVKSGVVPCGLGARDSLRLEVFYPLYGNDIDDETTPLEAGLNWIVRLKKPDFVGKRALEEQRARGPSRKLAGFRLTVRGFPRHGMPVYVNGQSFGQVRSGTVSPSLGEPLGTCYLPASSCAVGTRFEVDIRGKRAGAEVVETPFWKKGSRRA
jgi:aminomethyltransferase